MFSFFQDFDFMTSLKVFQYFSKFSQSQAGHKPGQTPKDPKAKKKNKMKQRIDGNLKKGVPKKCRLQKIVKNSCFV